jgi:hypothetical protein
MIANLVNHLPTQSDPEQAILFQIKAAGLPTPQTQYKFAREVVGNEPGVRKRLKEAGLQDWKFDFAWVDRRLAVEVEGGTWSGGRHVRGGGFEGDCRKYNEATLLNWRIFRFTTRMVMSGEALGLVERALKVGDSLAFAERG